MSQIAASPIAALVGYYQRLARDPTSAVPEFGFSREKIHFQVILEPDGSLAALEDLRVLTERGKMVPTVMEVPDGGGRSGVGVKPFFCWDNTGYALGSDHKGNIARGQEKFAAFRDLHLASRAEVGRDAGFDALCKFLEQWQPHTAAELPSWEHAAGKNVVFRLRGHEGFVHQSIAVRRVWLRRAHKAATVGAMRGVSLVSGMESDLARLHPLISGVAGANTTGAALVSFNEDAYTSYGRIQSYNAPVGLDDAFRYTTALGLLLTDSSRRVRVGDATVVFWADRAEARDAEALFATFFAEDAGAGDASESGAMVDRLCAFLVAARQGRLVDHIGNPEAPFYILALSPNASRLNVRFWLAGTVAEFAERLARHADDLTIAGERDGDPPLVLRRLLLETAREPKDIAPRLAGDLARAVLGGLPYPRSLFSSLIRRVRADGRLSHRRAAILKAVLVRNDHMEVSVSLNKDHPGEAYHLGRLFAALEKTQEDSAGRELNSTIRDRYFGAAAATPGAVFPLLLRLHQHHLNKVANVGLRVTREKVVGEICTHVSRFPTHLALDGQGLFYVGYYHQRQDFFTKKVDDGKETANA